MNWNKICKRLQKVCKWVCEQSVYEINMNNARSI